MTQTALEQAIEKHVSKSLSNYKPIKIRGPKVVHDPIHGSNLFTNAEVAVIDLPLIQRLRHISQTDIASFVYPSCHHTRFDHTLGVAVIAGRVMNALRQSEDTSRLITEQHVIEVRLAALLHDIGHGPFSHMSEETYKRNPLIKETRDKYPGYFSPEKPHEMMSYLMVTCEPFKSYFENEIVKPYRLPNVDLERVGRMIIGRMENPDLERYLGDVINGVCDADKLYYIQRDAYFSGLRMAVDIDRIMTSMWVPSQPGQSRFLAVQSGAVSALEQILFDKMQLHSTIYHHQKVRAAECLLRAIFEVFSDDPATTVNGCRLKEPWDFLQVSDPDIMFGGTQCDALREYVGRLRNRVLFKRALVISADTIENIKENTLEPLLKFSDDWSNLRIIREYIAENCSLVKDLKDVWIDLPTLPSLREPSQLLVMDRSGDARPLEDYFPTKSWLKSYGLKKWRGHIFCYGDSKTRKQVAEFARDLFAESSLEIKLKPEAITLAKID